MISTWAGFRCHVLIPHDLVTAVLDYESRHSGLTVSKSGERDVYRRAGREVFAVSKSFGAKTTRVTLAALVDLWIQEPGVTVVVEGDGFWRGFGRNGKLTYPARRPPDDPHLSTLHFSRVRSSPNYTTAVSYASASDKTRYRFRSNDGGFAVLLDEFEPKPSDVPWERCEVFNEGYPLRGFFEWRSELPLRRIELTGLRGHGGGQLHWLGWTGGPGAVVSARGIDEGAPANVLLWDPTSYRKLRAGRSIAQTLVRVV